MVFPESEKGAGDERFRVGVSLDLVDAQRGQRGVGHVILDAFRHDAQSQRAAHLDDGLDDPAPARMLAAPDQALIDLELAERHLAHTFEAGIAGPEIVDG